MPYVMDSELAARLAQLQPELARFPAFQPGDVLSWRDKSNAFYALLNDHFPEATGIETREFFIPMGNEKRLARWYQNAGEPSRGTVLFVHGGGGVSADIAAYHKIVANYVAQSGVSFLALDYHLAPEIAGDSQAEQIISGLAWLQENSAQLSIEPDRIVLMGDSGGGGIAASAAILARDRHIALAGQILVYPMLDDRTTDATAEISPFLTITASEIQTAWRARIPDGADDGQLNRIIPARLDDFTGLAPTYIDVGELDLFCAENLAWAGNLAAAGVPVEFHLYPGVNHGFELLAPHSAIAQQAMRLRCSAIRRLTA
ncbi:alpha/beta hydrolase fold domain-containing protein [Sodalis sp. RH19]|uniref:alpha/beta hydrolase fold domain-containing protein n=1 Tax=unclassified Sodalis (in: enterobacteria) TaxID=2636512 RepID=UPI0039B6268C